MIKESNIGPERTGTCELCGGHNRELRVMALTDFIGWACGECREQLSLCTPRRFCSAGESSEPGE